MNRPLVAVVVAYVSGLLLAHVLPAPLPGAILVLALISGLVLRWTGWISVPRPRTVWLWLLLALAGWANFTLRTTVRSSQDLRLMLGNTPALVTVRGTLAESPRLKIVQHGDQEKWHAAVRVRVREIQRDNGPFQPATGEVLAAAPDVPGPDFFSGQPVEIAGVAAPPPAPLAEGMFDYRAWLAMRGIYYQLRTESTHDWKLLAPRLSRPPLTDRFLAWAHRTLALGLPEEDEPLRLLWAMTLGWRTAFTGDLADPFLQAGTMHMFAVDGLRIALVSGLIVTLLRLVRLSRAWCGAIAIPALWFYTAATGWEASAMRASVMMTLVLGGWALKRPGDLLNSLASAAFVILVADPRQLFEASFQLSFGVMLVIARVLPPLNAWSDQWLARWLAPDPLLPDRLVPPWRKQLAGKAQAFGRFCGLSLAAWLGSLPLSAAYFHLFSPVSTLANLPAVPLGAGALTANLGALLCGQWLPWLTSLFNHAAWAFMVAMTWVSVKAAQLPGAYYYVREPSLAAILAYYAVILIAGSGWFTTARRKTAGLAALGGLVLAYGGGCLWPRAQTELTVLPLNGGHAVFVTGSSRDRWLINCGNADAVNFTLKNYLRAQGVNTLPRLVLADGNARNCGGAAPLDALFPIGELWTSAAPFRPAAGREAVAAFETKAPARYHVFHYGDTNGPWQVLFPGNTPRTTGKTGDSALVLRGDFYGTRVLLLSELSRAGQSELLAAVPDLRADIVIAGLPEEGEPLCDALLAAVHPRRIVIADSEYPAARRARPALLERLARTGIPVLYTRTASAVKITVTKRSYELERFQKCCSDARKPSGEGSF